MRFGNETLLWLMAAGPLLALFYGWASWRRQTALRRFADPATLARLTEGASTPRRIFKMVLIMTATVLLALALARPQWGSKMELVQRKGLDIVIAVDVSLSMLAEDIRPNRLVRSKQEIQRFVERLEGDRAGLVAFAGDAFLQCPLTSDYGAFRIFLDVLEPGLIDAPGTDIARAMETALKAFPSASTPSAGQGKHRVMILLTDGEDHGGRALKVAEAAAEAGVIIYTVGIGSESGVPIPLGGGTGSSGFKRDKRGEIVSTRLDPKLLAEVARITGGEFYHAQPGRFELLDVLTKINAMEKRTLDSERLSRFEERYQIPLGLAVFLLILELLISDRRRSMSLREKSK